MSRDDEKVSGDQARAKDPLDPTTIEADVVIEFYRASGPGGQRRNKVETAVRIKHLPTGLVVTCCDERSQKRNRDIAMKRLVELLRQRTRKARRRIRTRKPASVKKGEIEQKRKHAEKKRQRRSAKQKDLSDWDE